MSWECTVLLLEVHSKTLLDFLEHTLQQSLWMSNDTAQKNMFSIKQMWPNLQEPADLVTFIEEILNGKLHFFVQCDVKLCDSEVLSELC